MKTELCKHHNLPKISGHFCKMCKEDLDKTMSRLNNFFNSPKVTKIIQEVLEQK